MRLSLYISAIVVLGVLAVLGVDGYHRAADEQIRDAERAAKVQHAYARALAAAAQSTAERHGTQRAFELLEDVEVRTDGLEIAWRSTERTTRETPERTERPRAAHGPRAPLWLDGPGELVLRHTRDETRKPLSILSMPAARATVTLALVTAAIIVATHVLLLGLPLQLLLLRVREVGGGTLPRGSAGSRTADLGEIAYGLSRLAVQLQAARERMNRVLAEQRAAFARVCDADRWTTLGRLTAGFVPQIVSRLAVLESRAAALARRSEVPQCARSDAQRLCEHATDLALGLRPLLEFSEHEGRGRPALDLRLIVSSAVDLLADTARERRVELSVSGDADPVVAPVDPSEIQQLLVALTLNAIYAQPEGGFVRIAAHCDCTPFVQPGLKIGARSYVCLVVDDDGVGMTSEVQQQMFEPFFTTRNPGEGNGLGLAAVAVILETHRGFVGVETAPQAGTRMTVFLPRSKLD